MSKDTLSGNIEYVYTANGDKLQKKVMGNNQTQTIDYLNGFQYKDGSLDFIQTSEGYVKAVHVGNTTEYHYVYHYTDHLGNIRLSYGRDSETNEVAILKENHYYPFGLEHQGYVNNHQTFPSYVGIDTGLDIKKVELIPVRNYLDDSYRYTFGGKEEQLELGLNWLDFHARSYDAALGRWMSVDPHAENYYSISPYAYVANNPIGNIDPDGRDIIPVHGTWSNIRTWGNLSGIRKASNNLFSDNRLGASYAWSGDNFSGARTNAAIGLIDHVRTQMQSEEFNGKITLAGHSHGGNVSIEALNMMVEMEEFNDVEFNLLTINTPVRDDYQLSETATGRVNHVNVYDEKDPVQSKGGNSTANKIFGIYLRGTRTGHRLGEQKGSGELGAAGRTFDNAQNISVDNPQGLGGDFHNSHNRVNDWIDKTENK